MANSPEIATVESVKIPPQYIIAAHSDVWRDWRRIYHLIMYLAKRHLITRYRGSALGFLWSFLNPLMMMVVYTFVFRFLFGMRTAEVPYALFFLTGMFAWNVFSVGVSNAAASLVEGSYLYNKAYFPRIAIPMGAIVSNLMNYLIVVPLLLFFVLVFRVPLTTNLLWFPVGVLLLFLFTTAVGLFVAILAPGFRDVMQLTEIFMQVWFYLTPVLYPMSLPESKLGSHLGGWAIFIYKLNPMVGIIRFMQSIFLGMPMPGRTLIVSTIVTLIMLVASLFFFTKTQHTITERI